MDVDPNEFGLAPKEALDWLRIQRRHAWHPERVKTALEDGASPLSLPFTAPRGGRRLPGRPAGTVDQAFDVDRDTRRLEAVGARVLPIGHRHYPPSLETLVDPPVVLLARGRGASAMTRSAIAIVGARAATRAACDTAHRLARELAARGLVIVSGLARGIDAAAHRGALEARGTTIAVLAGGIDRVYPPEHRGLAAEIEERGAIVGEMPLGTAPRRELFPLRNRIISGLALGVIVVEARERSGSLITVRHALDQGREVFVVPGGAEGPFAGGSNRLLRDGARAVQSAEDVLEDLGLGSCASVPSMANSMTNSVTTSDERGRGSAEAGSPVGSSPIEQMILDRLERAASTRDDLAAAIDAPSREIAAALLDLELEGRVVEERDGRIHLCWR